MWTSRYFIAAQVKLNTTVIRRQEILGYPDYPDYPEFEQGI